MKYDSRMYNMRQLHVQCIHVQNVCAYVHVHVCMYIAEYCKPWKLQTCKNTSTCTCTCIYTQVRKLASVTCMCAEETFPSMNEIVGKAWN